MKAVASRGVGNVGRLVIFIGAALASTSQPVAAAPRIVWHKDVAAATRESKSDAKPLLVKFSTSWCGYCVKMQRETFSDPSVIHRVEQCFVPLAVDGDQHKELARRLGIKSFPTTLIVSPQQEVLKKIVGFRSAEQLRGELQQACDRGQHPQAVAQSSSGKPSAAATRISVFRDLCPVSLVSQGVAVKGQAAVSADYEGYRLYFRGEEQKRTFLANPERFWPAVDGVCVVSAVEDQEVRYGQLQHAVAYGGRIWLFATAEHLDRFLQDTNGYVERLRTRSRQRNPSVARQLAER